MRVKRTDIIGGIQAGTLREFLRHNHRFSDRWFLQSMKVSPSDAKSALMALVEQGYIVASDEEFELGPIAGSLIKAKFRTTKRASADAAVKALEERIQRLNEQDFVFSVTTAVIFGSYIKSDAPVIGDVDISVELHPRYQDRTVQRAAEHKRIIQSNRRFSNLISELTWPKDEVIKYLKGGSPVLDFTEFYDSVVQKAITAGEVRYLTL